MANSLKHALPYCVRKARFTLPLSFRVAAGTPTDPTTPDTEFSADGGATFTDCAEEITTGGGNGMGYLTLTGAETDNNVLLIAGKSANCLTTPAVIYPRILPVIHNGTATAGGATSITLQSGAPNFDLSGCIVRTTGGTGGGGTGGANNQAQVITAYNTGTRVATVSPGWETNPDSTTTYDILLTETTLASALVLTQAIPLSNNAESLGDCLLAARGQGFGPWAITSPGGIPTLTLYASDGVTAIRIFTLDSLTAPTQRT